MNNITNVNSVSFNDWERNDYKIVESRIAGMISRGLRGLSPLVKVAVHFGGLSSLKFLFWPCFSKCIVLASNVS